MDKALAKSEPTTSQPLTPMGLEEWGDWKVTRGDAWGIPRDISRHIQEMRENRRPDEAPIIDDDPMSAAYIEF